MEFVTCDYCGSNRYTLLFELYDYWYNRKDLSAIYVRCLDCGLIYQNPRRTAEELVGIYPSSYLDQAQSTDLFSATGMRKRCKAVIRHNKGTRLLDIGCGSGNFMQKMRDWYGWEVTGTDIDVRAVNYGRERYHLNILPGSIETIKFEEKSFDAITLWDVLEHLPSPSSALKEIKRILSANGVLILRVPNEASWDARIFGKYWAGYDCPRHFFVFNKTTLVNFLQANGFTVIDIRTDIGSYLNLVKSVQFWLTGKAVSEKKRLFILTILKSIPFRILGTVYTWLNNIDSRGTAMVIAAKHNGSAKPL